MNKPRPITIFRAFTDGVVAACVGGSDRYVWCIGGTRKDHHCFACHRPIVKGERCYHPLSNGRDRMRRVCEACINGAIENTRTT